MNEADIVINGVKLSIPQSMAVRVAIASFLFDMAEPDALGDDEHGKKMRELYQLNAGAVQTLIFRNLNKHVDVAQT